MQPISGSVFRIQMTPGPLSASGSYVTGASTAVAGQLTSIFIISADQYGNQITTCEASSSDWVVQLNTTYNSAVYTVAGSVSPCFGGQYPSFFNVTIAVVWNLWVTYLNQPINYGIPYTVSTSPSNIISTVDSFANGTGIYSGVAGNTTFVNIVSVDIYGNEITNYCGPTSAWTIQLQALDNSSLTCSNTSFLVVILGFILLNTIVKMQLSITCS